jgi:hypothetical protein
MGVFEQENVNLLLVVFICYLHSVYIHIMNLYSPYRGMGACQFNVG